MRKILFALGLFACSLTSNAQQDPQFSHFMYDKLSINPGFAGIDRKLCGTMFYRNQWMGFGNQPTTALLNVHSNVDAIYGGLGLTLYSDKLGFQSNTSVRLAYSYHLNLSPTMKLGIGLSAGMISVGYNATWVAVDDYTTDAAIPGQNSSQATYDLGFGVYLKGQDYYVGLSSMHLSESELSSLSFKNKRHYYLMAGYDYQINTDFAVLPAMRVESDATATQVDISARAMWKDMVWLGAGYRIKDAFYPLLGYQKEIVPAKKGVIRVGLTYDVTTSEIKNYSNNGLELFVNYCMNLDKPYKPEKYKTVRFL